MKKLKKLKIQNRSLENNFFSKKCNVIMTIRYEKIEKN